MAKKTNRIVDKGNVLCGAESETSRTPDTVLESQKKKKFLSGFRPGERIAAIAICLLLAIGASGAGLGEQIVSAFNSLTGNQNTSQTGQTSENSSIFSKLNPFAAAATTATPQLSKEYIYAGSRLLAVEDAGASAVVTPTATPSSSFEGDAAPRPNGDELIQSNDVIQVQRFLIGFDQPFQSNEFQRADAAPFSTRGNGVIDSADLIQAQRYSIGLEARQAAAGPTAPISGGNAPEIDESSGLLKSALSLVKSALSLQTEQVTAPRQLRVQSTTGVAGQIAQVNLLIDALGDEAAVSFTLTYNNQILQNPSVTIGTAGGSRYCNTTLAGQITCSVKDFQTDRGGSTDQIGEIAAGNDQLLVRANFTVAANAAAGTTALTLSGVSAATDAAQSLLIGSQNGAVTISATTGGTAATLLGTDTTTKGNWAGVYGSQGYTIIGDSTNIPASLMTVAGNSQHNWENSTTDTRALNRANSSDRIAATWFTGTQFDMEFNFTDGQNHQLAIYNLDWDGGDGRQQTLEIIDSSTGQILDTQTISNFSGGKYLKWQVRGSIKVRVKPSFYNAVISGIFIDAGTPISATPTPTPTPNPTPTATPVTTPTPNATPTPTATPTPSERINVALAANGGTASASSQLSGGESSRAIDGVKNWATTGTWKDETPDAFPDWLQVNFSGTKTIDEIDVYSVKNDFNNPSDPTEADTFNAYGITSFEVQYWNGSSFQPVPNGSIANNNKVIAKVVFPAITTDRIRVVVNSALANYSRIVELQVWGVSSVTSTPTPTPSTTPTPNATPTPTATPTPGVSTNVALTSNGGTASASSQFNEFNPPSNAIDGSRTWANGTGWKDATVDFYPDWLQVDFSGSKTISEIDVFAVKDDFSNPDVPTESTTFSIYGITNFEVQYWNGSGWTTVQNGSVVNNNKVWRKFSFPAVTTTKIRVTVNNAQASYSRIVELEAWTDASVGQAAFNTTNLFAGNASGFFRIDTILGRNWLDDFGKHDYAVEDSKTNLVGWTIGKTSGE